MSMKQFTSNMKDLIQAKKLVLETTQYIYCELLRDTTFSCLDSEEFRHRIGDDIANRVKALLLHIDFKDEEHAIEEISKIVDEVFMKEYLNPQFYKLYQEVERMDREGFFEDGQ